MKQLILKTSVVISMILMPYIAHAASSWYQPRSYQNTASYGSIETSHRIYEMPHESRLHEPSYEMPKAYHESYQRNQIPGYGSGYEN